MAEEDLIFGKNRHFFGGIEPSNMKGFSVYLENGVVKVDAKLPDNTVIDGQQLCTVRGGSDRMRTVTGAGCMLSVLCGAFAAVQPGDAFTAAVQAARFWKACAEQAEDHAAGAGSFRVALFDAAGSMADEVFAGE